MSSREEEKAASGPRNGSSSSQPRA